LNGGRKNGCEDQSWRRGLEVVVAVEVPMTVSAPVLSTESVLIILRELLLELEEKLLLRVVVGGAKAILALSTLPQSFVRAK